MHHFNGSGALLLIIIVFGVIALCATASKA